MHIEKELSLGYFQDIFLNVILSCTLWASFQICAIRYIQQALPQITTISLILHFDCTITACAHTTTANIHSLQKPHLCPMPCYSLVIIIAHHILGISFCYIPKHECCFPLPNLPCSLLSVHMSLTLLFSLSLLFLEYSPIHYPCTYYSSHRMSLLLHSEVYCKF